MSSATNKQRLLGRLGIGLKKHLDVTGPEARPVLEQVLYAIVREGASRAKADAAFARLQEDYFDWNEIRVSSAREVTESLRGLPDPYEKADRLVTFLLEVFETTFGFDLESMRKKGLKMAEKQLERYKGTTPYSVAYVVQNALEGHALPLDADMHRCLFRLDLVDEEAPSVAARTALEHQIPKARGSEFAEAVSAIAHEYCWDTPQCSSCPMNDLCPTGQENIRARASRGSRTAKAR